MNKNILAMTAAAAIALLAPTGAAFASQLVYHPVSPVFGGNPFNGDPLLSQAQAQGNGLKSGSQGPDLSGLTNALGNIGAGSSPVVVIGGSGSGSTNPAPGTNARKILP
jgi:curli production assembly/transport component CsgF